MHDTPQTLSVNQFCKKFGISTSMFYKLGRQGKGPKILKIGKRTLITAEAAQAWQEQMEEAQANF